MLFCGPVFVPAFALYQPNFKVNKPTFWDKVNKPTFGDRPLFRRNLQKNNIDILYI